jgi:hypothetical protein
MRPTKKRVQCSMSGNSWISRSLLRLSSETRKLKPHGACLRALQQGDAHEDIRCRRYGTVGLAACAHVVWTWPLGDRHDSRGRGRGPRTDQKPARSRSGAVAIIVASVPCAI